MVRLMIPSIFGVSIAQINLLINKSAKGVFNVCSNERINKYQFGKMIANAFGYSPELIVPISIKDIPDLTIRPKDMSLCNHKLCTYLDSSVPSLGKQIHELKLKANSKRERDIIPYGRQDISEKDILNVVDVLRSDYITQGPVVQKFERKVADYCNATHAYACNSATSALHIACLALGIGKGDFVWTSPISFVASSNFSIYKFNSIISNKFNGQFLERRKVSILKSIINGFFTCVNMSYRSAK